MIFPAVPLGPSCSKVEHLVTPVVCLLAVTTMCVSSARAQDAGREVSGGSEASDVGVDSGRDGASGTSVSDATSGDRRDGSSPDAGPSPREVLISEFHLDETVVDSNRKLAERAEALDTKLDRLTSTVDGVTEVVVVARAKREGVDEQLADLETAAPAPLVVGLARGSVRVARLEGRRSALRRYTERRRRMRDLVEQRRRRLGAEFGESVRETVRKRAQQARETEREALRAVERARKREQRERNKKLKELLATQRRLAETRLEFTKSHHDRIRQIRRKTRRWRETFATRKSDLLSRIDELPDSTTGEERRERIDPVFDKLVSLRRSLEDRYFDTSQSLRAASDEVDRAGERLRAAKEALRNERARQGPMRETELRKRRLETERARVELWKRKHEAAITVRDAYRSRRASHRKQLYFVSETVQKLLPDVSGRTYNRYFEIFDEDNWSDAVASLRWHWHGAYRQVRRRVSQAGELSDQLFSLSTFGWIGGLLWRALIVGLLVRLVFPAVPGWEERIIERALQRPFFRLRPATTVKAIELAATVARLGLLYFAVAVVGNYVAATFHEFDVLLAGIDAVFIYWLAFDVLSILAVPHRERDHEQLRRDPRMDLRHGAVEEARAAADLASLESETAAKFMRSARVVLVFGILAAYLPDLAVELTGPTILWYVLHQTATWGVVVIVYWVLSAWRDEIASGFERLAGARMAGAVEFVHKHKDRPWGVLVIGLTSIYLFGKQLVRLVRRYLLETQWFQGLSDFALRKSFELQRSGRETELRESSPEDLPADYRDHFRDEPVDETDDRHIHREGPADEIEAYFDRWLENHRQGSVALVGETGSGKTTELTVLGDRLDDRPDAPAVRECRVERRLTTRGEVLTWLSNELGIDGTYETSAELVEPLEQVDRRVIVLDDCQQLFVKQTGGFDGLEALLDVVSLTDERHFWCLSFNNFAWSYINRIRERSHYFGRVVDISGWESAEIREMIERRNDLASQTVHFGGVEASAQSDARESALGSDVSKNGYFRYLAMFSGGNPRVALCHWLRSLRAGETRTQLGVHLFHRPPTDELLEMSDDYWFVLAAIAQHDWIGGEMLAESTNIDEGFCRLALDYFDEMGIVEIDPQSGRARLSALYFRQVLEHLSNSNFIYG